MKRTIEEVIDLIEQKQENARIEFVKIRKEIEANNLDPETLFKKEMKGSENSGYIKAYEDVLALIRSSHLDEDSKTLAIIRKHMDIEAFLEEFKEDEDGR